MPPKKKKSVQVSGACALVEEDDSEVGIMTSLRSEIINLSGQLNNKLTLLETAVNEVRGGLSDIVKSISFLDAKFEEMKTKADRLEKDNINLKKQNAGLEKRVDGLTKQVQELDQYHRRVNLEFAGVPEKADEKPEEIALRIARRVAPTITAGDIDIAHRIGSSKSGMVDRRPRPIIVRFNNRRSRNAVYDGRKRMKLTTCADLGYQGNTNKIFINENLVAATRELLGIVNEARKAAGYKFLWTYNGRILVRKNEKDVAIAIHSKEDVAKLK